MNQYRIEDFSFAYEGESQPALQGMNLTIEKGKYYVICGQSGCGKSTLLRHLKSALRPFGTSEGTIYYGDAELEEVSQEKQSREIGYVFQNPDSQLVTDKVWHELAFGLESLGISQEKMDLAVAEMASYLGIQSWFHMEVSKLSGGQKQLLNLASVLALHPKVLVLDEPTSQLDPIAAQNFLDTIYRINKELGVTVILSEHHLGTVFCQCDQIVLMDAGRIVMQGTAGEIGAYVRAQNHPMREALPTSMKAYYATDNKRLFNAGKHSWKNGCPVSIVEGRMWMDSIARYCVMPKELEETVRTTDVPSQKVMKAVELWFRYQKRELDILKGLSFELYEGEILALMGGNGSGKSTLLKVLSGVEQQWQGKVAFENGYSMGDIGMLPQDPTTLFLEKTVEKELGEESEQKAYYISFFSLEELLHRHPYDLSGGERQKVALAKVLLRKPRILLLDEPTKGLDAWGKQQLGEYLHRLALGGTTIMMVSHDVEFCAIYANRVGLLFDGRITARLQTEVFFRENHFYTTAANRIAREHFPQVVTEYDLARVLGGHADKAADGNSPIGTTAQCIKPKEEVIRSQSLREDEISKECHKTVKYTTDVEREKQENKIGERKSFGKILFRAGIFVLYPLLIWFGSAILENRQYMLLGVVMAVYGCIPFFWRFEEKKQNIKHVVVLSSLTALAVIGRSIFFMTPSVKPMAAFAIITGISLGAESGFFVGALSMLVSNMLFGQGPWTPWQMFAMGLVGFVAGILFAKKKAPKKAGILIYGFVGVLVIYGGIINFASLLMASYEINKQTVIAMYASGFPMDLVHGIGTVLFLFLLAKPMLEKLDRIKKK